MANEETTTKSSRLKVFLVLKVIIVLLYSNLFVFKCFFYNYKGKLKSLIVKKMFIDIGFKEV